MCLIDKVGNVIAFRSPESNGIAVQQRGNMLFPAPRLLSVARRLHQTTPPSSNIIASRYIKLMNVYTELTSECVSFPA